MKPLLTQPMEVKRLAFLQILCTLHWRVGGVMNQNLRHSLATDLMHTTSEGVTGKKDLEASFWSDMMVLLQCQGAWLPAFFKPDDKMNADKYIDA